MRVWTFCKSERNSNLLGFNEFEDGDVHGWNYCIGFTTLNELVGKLDENNLRGRVSRLAINSHGGGGGGTVQLDETLRISNLSRFEVDLRRLSAMSRPPGRPDRAV